MLDRYAAGFPGINTWAMGGEAMSSFLDFIKNRGSERTASEQHSQQQPETAKQMHTREAIEEKANRVPVTADLQSQAEKIGGEVRKTTQPVQESAPPAPDAPADQGSNSAHLQKQDHQDKTQKPLSPTDDASGKTAVQEKAPTEEKSPDRTQKTIARPTPSWER
jgi:hypothetical protein